MNKIEFIESYIKKLEDALLRYCNNEITGNMLLSIIQETRTVLARKIPELDNDTLLDPRTIRRNAESAIGILKLAIINNKAQHKEANQKQLVKDLKKLRFEFGGIKAIICDYADDGNVLNYLDQLEASLPSHDIYGIKYCLARIDEWYDKSVDAIRNDSFCFNMTSHDENRQIIKQLRESFERYDDSIEESQDTPTSTGEPLIFLSHKSDDRKYADALERFIVGLGVKNHQLIYTSHQLHKIPLDLNIFDYLRKCIHNKVFMIILWSNAYLDSPACLNEMGAAWVTQSDYTNIYVPTFSFENPKYHECAVDTQKMGAVLNGDGNCKTSMIELKDKILGLFHLPNDEKQATYLLDQFMKEITEANSNGQAENAQP